MAPIEVIAHKHLTPTIIGVLWTPDQTTSPREKYVPPITGHWTVIGWKARGEKVWSPEQSAKGPPKSQCL